LEPEINNIDIKLNNKYFFHKKQEDLENYATLYIDGFKKGENKGEKAWSQNLSNIQRE